MRPELAKVTLVIVITYLTGPAVRTSEMYATSEYPVPLVFLYASAQVKSITISFLDQNNTPLDEWTFRVSEVRLDPEDEVILFLERNDSEWIEDIISCLRADPRFTRR